MQQAAQQQDHARTLQALWAVPNFLLLDPLRDAFGPNKSLCQRVLGGLALLPFAGVLGHGIGLAADAARGLRVAGDIEGATTAIPLFSRTDEVLSGGERSGLTAYGQGLISNLQAMGVEARYVADADEQRLLEVNNARGVTHFWGNTAADTQVLLRADANDATVYEEYLHVLEGQGRGWVGPAIAERLPEEIRVGQQVLARADELGMTSIERMELEGTIQAYIRTLQEGG